MAYAPVTRTVVDTDRRFVFSYNHISDGSNGGVTTIDASGLTANKLGQACTYLDIVKIHCNISTTAANDSTLVAFDADTDDTAILLNGDTDYDFSSFGGITNPRSTGVTGDIKITIPVQTANDSTFIMLECIKRYESLS